MTRERILLAGLALVDEAGLDAVSMRKLARRLGVDPMSLYNHVDGKDALLDGIAEILLAAIPTPPPEADLRGTMSSLAHGFRAAMLDHPRAAPLVLTRRLASMTALAPVEAVLGPLLAAGFPPERAVHGLRAVLAFLTGTLMREVEAAPTFGGSARRLADLSASGLPAVAAAAPYLAVCDHEAEFEFGLRIMLDALGEP
ncbi:TetR family transcriptional regulator [Amycolatopsis mediterranei S699]|uniref:TetR family transcriptional regulator n=3 Tax=Amycolatopsis mediterranei TaxID=33910 RepID=A0A0H3D3B1_AMYMU|nr:TetR/AcrR family transcriptional regulator C-terminal domain-containing protein [Amycolatopsis mediterranei]ADJ45140.1 TetR family transcriptional regulator [Amycolatopsis mediterranei U32]AEK41899.1 TetR family transcriptional regulator [Amycolatopsis mediterranei S699]AFO76850.1 TetR family transcriptional regulator [Amycolatopsis mediterranei S699]AGT83978.1 TetR family transcriptional regulator [Amycolatopsis mediterranei RB]KDO08615.1 TetR family transcriptional regulator [Amycolatopsi